MTNEPFSVTLSDGTILGGERRMRPGATTVVFLHAGVADRRGWRDVMALLDGGELDLIAYDRRGYGDTPAGTEGFTHLQDLHAVLDAARPAGPVVLVGNSMGGALALDLALTAPDRVAGVLLIGAGVSGMTDEGESIDWTVDAGTGAVLGPLEQAEAVGDVDEQVRLLLHLWLDGPLQREGRVGGPARELAADMNRRIIAAGGGSTGESGLDAWHRLSEITTPVLATWGALDLPPDLPFYALAAERLGQAEARVLPGVAHLPSLEQPELVADLVRQVVGR